MVNVEEWGELSNLYFLKTWKFEWELLWNYDYNERATQKQYVKFTNSRL